MSAYNCEELGKAVVDAATALSKDPIGRVLVQMSAERGCTYRTVLAEFERSEDMRQTVMLRLAHASLLNLEHQMAVQVSAGQRVAAAAPGMPQEAPCPSQDREPGQRPVRAPGGHRAGDAPPLREACPGCGRSRVPGGPWVPPGGVWALPALVALCGVVATVSLPPWGVTLIALVCGVLATIVWRALTLRPCARCGTD